MFVSSLGLHHGFAIAFVNGVVWLKLKNGSWEQYSLGVCIVQDGSLTLEGQFGWKQNPWLTLFFKDLVGYSVSPSAYVVVERPNARQFPPFYQYK